jgi:hypothetical protein
VPGVIFILTYRFNFDRLDGGGVCEFNAQYIADRKGKGEGDSVIGKMEILEIVCYFKKEGRKI